VSIGTQKISGNRYQPKQHPANNFLQITSIHKNNVAYMASLNWLIATLGYNFRLIRNDMFYRIAEITA
jgi:hypothetical protein